MRTKIAASWIVAHDQGKHALIRDGEVVFEGNRILHVGRGFEGRVDKTIDAKGKLVAPGFIDTHVHSGHRASHRLITDTGRPMYYIPAAVMIGFGALMGVLLYKKKRT